MKIRKMLFGLMFVLFWVQNGVQAEPAQEFVLNNGMKVVVREDHRLRLSPIWSGIVSVRWMKRTERRRRPCA